MTESTYIQAVKDLLSGDPVRVREANRELFNAACLNGELLTPEEKARSADLVLAAAGM